MQRYLTVLTLAAAATAHAAALRSNLVLDLRFDNPLQAQATRVRSAEREGPADKPVPLSIRTPADPAGNGVPDNSPCRNHGTAEPGVRWERDGLHGGAFRFNGDVMAVRIPDAPTLSFGGPSGDRPFSVCVWARMEDATNFRIASKGHRKEWSLATEGTDRLRFRLCSEWSLDTRYWTARTPFTDSEGAWHLYSLTFSGAGGSNDVAMYRDGQPLATTYATHGSYQGMPDTDAPLLVGGWGIGAALGLLDDFRIYDRSLSAEEVRALYMATREPTRRTPEQGFALDVAFPEPASLFLTAPTPAWTDFTAVQFDITLPPDAATNTQVLVHLKDWDYLWYQNLLPGYLVPGEKNRCRVELTPNTAGWRPRGHHGTWQFRALAEPKEVGIRIFAQMPYAGTLRVSGVCGIPRDKRREPPPTIRNVRANVHEVGCFQKFELTFELPDRYADPFDSANVSVVASFTAPDGTETPVHGFFAQDYYSRIDHVEERALPAGPPYWRVRFTPTRPGTYSYMLRVTDLYGTTQWGPATFEATPRRAPGFVRVSTRDPRYFECDDGSPFFAIGHNTRSPSDTRMDQRFRWVKRWPRDWTAYRDYFQAMHEHGENMAEIWCAPWSFGLEWHPDWRGYHGIGQFNLMHAWHLDRVMELAEQHEIRLNFVIHNHGKFSAYSDESWLFNPFSVEHGGYLRRPLEYFSDPRALAAFEKLMRYTVARWGYSTSVMCWELWSELDLTGARRQDKIYKSPEVEQWHRRMGRFVKQLDPNDHLVATHVCGSYTHQATNLISLTEMDWCPIDAYYGERDPLRAVELLRESCEFNNPYGKPVLVTEFGGSSAGAGMEHLRNALHGALWASTCLPMAGTPLFWWWQLIEEENLYTEYAAIARFMQGEDRRDPSMLTVEASIVQPRAAEPEAFGVCCIKSPTRALAWVYRRAAFTEFAMQDASPIRDAVLEIPQRDDARFTVEFWDTQRGARTATVAVTARHGTLGIALPPFVKDIALKIRATPSEQEPPVQAGEPEHAADVF